MSRNQENYKKMGSRLQFLSYWPQNIKKMEQFHWLKISTFCNLGCRRYFSLLTILPSIIWHSAPIQTIFYPFWVFLEVHQFFDQPCPFVSYRGHDGLVFLGLNDLKQYLNSIEERVQWTMELEEERKLPSQIFWSQRS